MMTFGSLFAGIGGFDLGLERAGMKCKWQVEIDPFCRKVLQKHWPEVPRYRDVREIEKIESVDIICGGPPCQRTSVAAAIFGNRTGESLWGEMARIVQENMPTWVIVEQPPGNKKWETEVTVDLEGLGYCVDRFVRSALLCGAPHERRRVFFVANTLRERLDTFTRLRESSSIIEKSWPSPPRGTWRSPRTGTCRMDDGLPDWVDRIKSLGNAVIPQVIKHIGLNIINANNGFQRTRSR